MTEFQKYLKSYFNVKDDVVELISNEFESKTIKKGDYFLKENESSNELGFVQSGILREFTINDSGKEITKWISTKGFFIVDIISLYFEQPSRWNIQALTDCAIFVINRRKLNLMPSKIKDWNNLQKLFITKCFGTLENRIVEQISLNAEERYEKLFEFNKELFNEVPLQYLASMIGVAPETFSRIRNKKANS